MFIFLRLLQHLLILPHYFHYDLGWNKNFRDILRDNCHSYQPFIIIFKHLLMESQYKNNIICREYLWNLTVYRKLLYSNDMIWNNSFPENKCKGNQRILADKIERRYSVKWWESWNCFSNSSSFWKTARFHGLFGPSWS